MNQNHCAEAIDKEGPASAWPSHLRPHKDNTAFKIGISDPPALAARSHVERNDLRLSTMSLQRFDVDQLLSWGSRGAGLSDILIRFHCKWIGGVQSCRCMVHVTCRCTCTSEPLGPWMTRDSGVLLVISRHNTRHEIREIIVSFNRGNPRRAPFKPQFLRTFEQAGRRLYMANLPLPHRSFIGRRAHHSSTLLQTRALPGPQ
jgi:hypothetical protein